MYNGNDSGLLTASKISSSIAQKTLPYVMNFDISIHVGNITCLF